MANAKRDENSVPTLLGVSSADGVTPVVLWADPTTHRLLTDSATGMSNPMTAGGDIIYGGALGTPTKLVNGNLGEVLTSQGGTNAPIWSSAGAGDMVLASVQTVTGAKTFGTIGGAVGKLILAGSTSGSSILNAAAVAGTTTITLPGTTTVLAGLSVANSFTTSQAITPTSDVISLAVRRNGAGQSANVLEIQTEANAFLAGFDKVGKLTAPSILVSGLTASELVATDGSSNLSSLAVATYPSLTEISYIKGLTSAIQTQLNGKAATLSGTINEIAYFSSASTIASLAVATYPSLTELSYVKGVTSAIQTQIGNLVAKATYDAHTVLYATTDNTPVALTVGEQTLVGRATGGNISAIAIDSDLSSVSANDDTVPSAKATKAMGDLKLPLAGGTMSGNITLGENTGLALDPAGSADGKWTGITVTGVAGYSQAFGDLVTLDKDDSRWEAVDISVASAATRDARGILGMVVSTGTDGTACTILLNGIIRADANFPALTIGAAVYASTTGDIVVTQPVTTDYVIRQVGFALTADEIAFQPTATWTTHV